LSDWKNPTFLAVLAASYAAAGRFEEAVKLQKKALEDPAYAKANGQAAQKRLKLYQQKTPFREE
jgi:hypothetical protein